jgi:hypothetical protein
MFCDNDRVDNCIEADMILLWNWPVFVCVRVRVCVWLCVCVCMRVFEGVC